MDYDDSKIDDDLDKLLQHIKEEQQNSLVKELRTHVYMHTRSVNKVMRLPAYRTIWQYCGLALHMKVR